MFRVAFDDLDRFVITVFLFVAFGLMLGAYSRSIVTPGISKANAGRLHVRRERQGGAGFAMVAGSGTAIHRVVA